MNASADHPDNGEARTGRPGIIDTIGLAFALLNQRPYLVWLPIAVDFALWSGLRLVIIGPLGWLGRSDSVIAGRFSEVELLGMAGWLMPTLIDAFGDRAVPDLGIASGAAVQASFGPVLVTLTLMLALVIGVTYLTMVGRLVTDRPAWGIRFLSDSLSNAARVALAVASVISLLAFLLLPFAVLGGALHVAGVDPVALLSIIVVISAVWAVVFFVFAVHALVLGETRVFQALRSSYAVVQRNFMSVVALFLIVILIRVGTPLALQIFTESNWSVPFAIVVNAYVATGLIAATMIYFRDRSAEPSLTPSAANAAGASD